MPTTDETLTELTAVLRATLGGFDGFLVLTAPPTAELGTIGSVALDIVGLAFYGPKTESGWGSARWTGGANGWTPVLALESDGARRVLKVVDWTGGGGTKPAAPRYIGASGLVTTAAEAVDVRGPAGVAGTDGWTPMFTLEVDGERRVMRITDWTGGTGTKPGTGYLSASGLSATAAGGVDLRGPAGASGTGTGDVQGPATHANGAVPVWSGANSKTLGAGRAIGAAASTDLLDRAAGDGRYVRTVNGVGPDAGGNVGVSGGGGGAGLAGVTDYVLADLMDSASSAAITTPWGFADPLAGTSLLDLATSTGEYPTAGYVDNFTTPSLSVQGTPTGSTILSFGNASAPRPSGTEAAGDVGIVLFYVRPAAGTTPIDLTGMTWRSAAMTLVGSQTSSSGARLYVYRYTITGAETGAAGVSASWGGSVEARSAMNVYRVRGANPLITAAFATGTNPPNLSGLAAGKTNLFVAAVAGSSGTASDAEAPADYTDVVNAANFSGQTAIVSARRIVAATSNDPGTFINAPTGTNLTLACTVGVEPANPVVESMSLVWVAFTAPTVPSRAAVMVEVEPITGSIAPNTNVLVDVSRNGGASYTTAVLALRKTVGAQRQLADVLLDLTGQSSAADVRLRVRANTDSLRIHKAGVLVG